MLSYRTVNIFLFIVVMFVLGMLISKEYAELQLTKAKKNQGSCKGDLIYKKKGLSVTKDYENLLELLNHA